MPHGGFWMTLHFLNLIDTKQSPGFTMGNLYIMNAKHKGCKNVSSLLPFTHNHPHFTKHKITHTSQNTKSSTLHKTQNHPPF